MAGLGIETIEKLFGKALGAREGHSRSHGEEMRDRRPAQSPGGEEERLERGSVEPLRIIHQHGERSGLRCSREQRQRSHVDGEAVSFYRRSEQEGRLEGGALPRRQLLQVLDERVQNRRERRERELRLAFDPGYPEDAHLLRRGRHLRVPQECGLPDSSLSPDHQSATLTRPCGAQQLLDLPGLALPAQQHRGSLAAAC